MTMMMIIIYYNDHGDSWKAVGKKKQPEARFGGYEVPNPETLTVTQGHRHDMRR